MSCRVFSIPGAQQERITKMVRTMNVAEAGYAACCAVLKRNALQDNPRVEAIVQEIIADVRARGDAALLELSRRFDSPELTTLEVPRSEWDAAEAQVSPELRAVIESSAVSIREFHEKQRRNSWTDIQPERITGQMIRPLDTVGFYIPGGTAAYPSSLLMTVIPAKTAGVPQCYVTTPARKDGTVSPLVLYAAKVAGADRLFTVGGAQAIAALAFGTDTIPAVDKIVGPGNQYVNIAKKRLWGVVDIDMLAGPSEVCVVADAGADPKFAALDLLTQAEHDIEAAAFLMTPSAEFARAVQDEIARQLEVLPRAAILRESLMNNSVFFVTESLAQAYERWRTSAPRNI